MIGFERHDSRGWWEKSNACAVIGRRSDSARQYERSKEEGGGKRLFSRRKFLKDAQLNAFEAISIGNNSWLSSDPWAVGRRQCPVIERMSLGIEQATKVVRRRDSSEACDLWSGLS